MAIPVVLFNVLLCKYKQYISDSKYNVKKIHQILKSHENRGNVTWQLTGWVVHAWSIIHLALFKLYNKKNTSLEGIA